MAGIKSFSGINGSGLLGNMGQGVRSLLGVGQPDQYQALLGADYNPRGNILGSILTGAGVGLMTGDWGKGFAATQAAQDEYQRRALMNYKLKQDEENRRYQRSRDQADDTWRQKQWDYRVGLDKREQDRLARQDAWTNTQNRHTMDQWQQEDDLRAGKQNAVEDWNNNFVEQGGTLPLSPAIRGMARQDGIEGVTGQDLQRYGEMQPFMQAGDYGNAFDKMTATPEYRAPIRGNAGDVFLDPYTMQPVGAIPKDPEPPKTRTVRRGNQEVTQEWDATSRTYKDVASGDAFKTTPDVINNVNTEGDSYAKERGKAFATSMSDYEGAEKSGFDTLASVQTMQTLMQDPNFYSGWAGQPAMAARQFLATMGGDPNAAASMEAFNAESKRMALASMGGSLGTGFSNADRDFVTYQVANLDTSEAGNKSLLEINKRVAQRKIEIARMARDYEIRNGRIDARFKQQLAQWSLANPLFPEASGMDIPKPQNSMSSDPFGLRKGSK